ncbi:MAG: hypothetical protein HUK02_08295 [Bacteroidaceae bacterium]|nr:hypothetical protein [Bacteroidaceae bacterium]
MLKKILGYAVSILATAALYALSYWLIGLLIHMETNLRDLAIQSIGFAVVFLFCERLINRFWKK